MNGDTVQTGLAEVARLALDYAHDKGLDQAELSIHQGTGISVTARQQELETVEKHNDAQLVVNVFKNQKTGSASSADLGVDGVREMIDAAASIADHTGADDCFGLADKELMATNFDDLGLFHPWPLDVSQFADLVLECERSALQFDSKISNSEGASVNSYSGTSVYANSHGFYSERQLTQHSLSCSVIAQSENGMQRDYWYDSNRDPSKLAGAEDIGLTAAKRTVNRLDARKIASTETPVLFDANTARSLINHLMGALKGGVIYKKASFMLDRIGDRIMPDFVTISENPHLPGGIGSTWHDNEGVATLEQAPIVTAGQLQRYLLGCYTARKLGMQTTANAGGVHNLSVSDTGQSFDELLALMNTGLLVTELIGSGINMLTGDYSRGAAGYWVENGELAYPVEEITVAGNLLEMYRDIVAIGTDRDLRGNTRCGSILLQKLTLAGS